MGSGQQTMFDWYFMFIERSNIKDETETVYDADRVVKLSGRRCIGETDQKKADRETE